MTIRLAIIGLGSMGALHLDSVEAIEGVEVTAVCARDARQLTGDLRNTGGNLSQTGRLHDFTRVRTYTDWRELLRDPDVDAVDICMPSDTHADVSLQALAAGKHVLCEKPMALNSRDCARVLAAAEEHRRVLMIAHTLRFWPDYQYLGTFARQQEIVEAFFYRQCGVPDWSAWLTDPVRSGGVLFDLMIHDIDQAIALFGMPDQVSAHNTGPIDLIRATLHYPHRKVHIEGGWMAAGTPFSMGFQVHSASEKLIYREGVLQRCTEEGKQVIDLSGEPGAYQQEIRYFAECCRTNVQPHRCPPQQSAQAVSIAEHLEASRRHGGQLITCAL